jgi:hypothetical protein
MDCTFFPPNCVRDTLVREYILPNINAKYCLDTAHRKLAQLLTVLRGAALSERGKPIIAMPSTTTRGESKIVPTLKPGAGKHLLSLSLCVCVFEQFDAFSIRFTHTHI